MSENSYKVKIIRNLDKKESWYTVDWSWFKNGEDGDLYWWQQGNFGCDCNRHASFELGLGNDVDDEERPCGEKLYSVPYAILPNGTKINIDEEIE